MTATESLRKSLTPEVFASYVDSAFLKPGSAYADYERHCREAEKYRFRMVAILCGPVKICKQALAGSKVRVGGAVGFPLGIITKETKLFETLEAIKNGADDIDYVINLTEMKEKNYKYIEQEMADIVDACRKHNVISKVIVENCYLTDQEKKEICRIAVEIRPDFLKTSTGFGPSGAVESDVLLMKKELGDKVKVKASGGLRDLDTTLLMIASGAECIASSYAGKIMEEFLSRM